MSDISRIRKEYHSGGDYIYVAKCQISLIDNDVAKYILSLEKQLKDSVSEEELFEHVENAHMAGQSDAGVDPSYSNAKTYRLSLLGDK